VKRRLRILPEAEAEIAEGAAWYEARRTGLGFECVAEVDAALERIEAAPDTFPRWRPDRDYRKLVVKRFPYVVFFRVSEHEIVIVAVAHSKRRPGYWMER
jgi:plasmid stabilization system protein ParE